MLIALLGFTFFCLIYYTLWSMWCRFAPDMLAPDAPAWAKRPNFFLFFAVTLVFVLMYRGASRE